MQAMIKGMDLNHCRAVYSFPGGREEVRNVLLAKPDFKREEREPDEDDLPDTEYYVWLRLGESQAIEKDMPGAFRHDPESGEVGTLGELKLSGDRLVFESFTRQKYEFGKTMLNKYLGGRIELQDEKVANLGSQLAKRFRSGTPARRQPSEEIGPSESLTPEEKAKIMEEHYRNFYRRFLDDKVPTLGGLTPREATGDPLHRTLLLELMKEHIQSIENQNRQEGLSISIDPVLRELGLVELL
jgi:hypothetical protein